MLMLYKRSKETVHALGNFGVPNFSILGDNRISLGFIIPSACWKIYVQDSLSTTTSFLSQPFKSVPELSDDFKQAFDSLSSEKFSSPESTSRGRPCNLLKQ